MGRRDETKVISRWRGRTVTLVEKHTGWLDGGGGKERPFAQLRYGADALWTLYYWVDAMGWRRYPDSLPETSPVPLLEDIDRSPLSGYFFATW